MTAKPIIAAYITGHGFGHYTRSLAVLERLAAGAVIHARTSAHALFLARQSSIFSSVTEVDVGPGVAQNGPLAVDLPATRARLEAHLLAFSRTVAAEAEALRAMNASLVYADVPPLAFAAAAAASLPSVGLGNFSWSWIYDGYAPHDPFFAEAASRFAEAEGKATRFLALDGGGGLEVFPARERVGPIARPPTSAPAETRRRLGLDDRDPRPPVLVTFGGFGAELDLRALAAMNPRFRFLLVGDGAPEWRGNARAVLPTDELPHQDLTAAAAALIGKPGYGTVAECLPSGTAFVHVPRGEFREHAPLVQALTRWLPSAPLSLDDLHAGRWSAALDAALAARPSGPAPDAHGLAEAVTRIQLVFAQIT